MVEYLKGQGWAEKDILLIDIDQGVSGTTKIDERPGMKHLYALITEGKIGAVACQIKQAVSGCDPDSGQHLH